MNWKNVGLAIGGLTVITVFRAAGWIGSFWTGVAVLGIIAGVAILQALPTTRLNIISKIFVIWLAVTVGLPAVWQAVSEQAPFTREASEMRAVAEDLRQAERIRPAALMHRVAYKRFVDRTDDFNGSKLGKEVARIWEDYRAGRISREEMVRRDKKIRARIITDQTWREDAGELLTGRGNPGYKTWREEVEELYNTPNRVIFWVLGLLVIVTSALLAIVRKKFSWVPIIFIILAVLGDRLAWGGLIPSGGSTFAQGNPASVSTQQRRTILRTEPNRWILAGTIPSKTGITTVDLPNADWIEYKFANGKMMRTDILHRRKFQINARGDSIGPPMVFPSGNFWIRTNVADDATVILPH
ncbi:MAG: hypothetical protein AAB476_01280 [Patescibacteria group bacterium]